MYRCLACDEQYAARTTDCARCGGRDFLIVGAGAPDTSWSLRSEKICALSMLAHAGVGALLDKYLGIVVAIVAIGLLIGHEKARGHAIVSQIVELVIAICAAAAGEWWLAAFLGVHPLALLALLTEQGGLRRARLGAALLALYWLALASLVVVLVVRNQHH